MARTRTESPTYRRVLTVPPPQGQEVEVAITVVVRGLRSPPCCGTATQIRHLARRGTTLYAQCQHCGARLAVQVGNDGSYAAVRLIAR